MLNSVFIVLLVLKLTGLLDISWWIVIAPGLTSAICKTLIKILL